MVRRGQDLHPSAGQCTCPFRPRLLQRRLEQAWRLRWYTIISCRGQILAASLLVLRGGQGSDGQMPPSHEVERDHAVALGV